ncbi:MAG: phosphoglucosamine mutase [Desulfarculus sp.]|nr:phosphoglucosamine mutase [Pseudomonadota bacterium]MBV1715420.1 phosphoglucosamine mutase [Desulfarculus sp.]MBU4574676.1 phosphoglucosamine mutase [Pseudomonadota bacterium]MBU4596233.1 phosphoglucosamine mutase [Pseudomonadota bacterium]MBV1737615.1 phosphoglucosamine mutase [Desulfarculus sp.]
MERKIFGTDGVRGVANQPPMTVEMAVAIGQGVASVLTVGDQRRKVILGKDTRLSGYMFENALLAGLCSMGRDVLVVGPLPTPALAFLTRNMRCAAGIVISASHNPYQDNGIKIFGHDGYKLPDAVEARIEDYVMDVVSCGGSHSRPEQGSVGRARRIDDALGRYIVFLKNSFPVEYTLDGMTVAMDCAHGATYRVAPAVFSELGAEVAVMGDKPDGTNINDGVGALHPEGLAELVKTSKADLGLAFDGDGDRLIMVDENGEVVDGDQIMALCADHLMTAGSLNHATLVATVMSNLGLELCLRERGIRMLRTKVGDRYVVEAMRRGGYNLGGEQSGHILFLDHNTTGDGIASALQVLSVMVQTGKKLSELKAIMTRLPQVLINVPVTRKPPIAEMPQLVKAMQAQEERLGETGRLLLRYSGTEPKLRIMVEAADSAMMDEVAQELKQVVLAELGAEG